jgi:hypothetical protein
LLLTQGLTPSPLTSLLLLEVGVVGADWHFLAAGAEEVLVGIELLLELAVAGRLRNLL